MIPIGDDDSDRRETPFVTWFLIAVNVFVFVALQGFGPNERFTMAFATGVVLVKLFGGDRRPTLARA